MNGEYETAFARLPSIYSSSKTWTGAYLKIKTVRIANFRSIKNLTIQMSDILALVGQNNAGKSNILKAIDFFFEPSTTKIGEESFYQGNSKLPIEITVEFWKLNDSEVKTFASYIQNGILKVKRRIVYDETQSKPVVSHIGFGYVPKQDWLNEESVSEDKIEEWWSQKDTLTLANNKFVDLVGKSKPTVSLWRSKIKEFVKQYSDKIECVEVERENIKGYEGVLKGGLPKFIFIPAVRHLAEEAKVTKTNPFGELVGSILVGIPQEHKEKLGSLLGNIAKMLNSEGGSERIDGISKAEEALNAILSELVRDCKIELKVNTPTVDDMFKTVRIIADDGFRGDIENKGHGLQRYVIFTILRAYAGFIRAREEKSGQEKSFIFAIEEPEIYLHPQAQRTMYQVLRTISQGKDQAIYSTHSSLLVDITYFDHICVVNKSVVDKRYETRIMQLSMQKMIDDLKARHTNSSPTELSMRDRYSHAYNPLRNEGFFARKIILVEGLSEEYCFPVYADALGYNLDVNGVSVINAGGKGIIDRLLRVFNEFGIPCYVIFDGDKNTNDNNLKKSTKELLNLLQCKEKYPTPTIIDKTFSVFETKFEDVMRTEISEYESFKSQAKEELGLGEAESKPLIARFIARQVVEKGKKEGDPGKYVPNSIQKIIPNVKELIWSGSLLKMST